MSIEKKSLISNRMATKKAIVTKPEVSKVNSTKISKVQASLAHTSPVTRVTLRTAAPVVRFAATRLRQS